MYDFVVVGGGLFGITFARYAADAGKSCIVLERRDRIGGNVITDEVEGIHVHTHGPHIFRTNSSEIWKLANRFAEFNSFVNRPKARIGDEIYSFPINLMTMYQLFGVKTPEEAKEVIAKDIVLAPFGHPRNAEEQLLSTVGKTLYEKFFYGYTTKQWGRSPRSLDATIVSRLPVRFTFDDNYFNAKFQGIPIGGYTKWMENMAEGVNVQLKTDFNTDIEYWRSQGKTVVFSGGVDELFRFEEFGPLEYRGLRFEHEIMDIPDFQGNAVINYPSIDVPWTRITEHKHFDIGSYSNINKTVVTKEYPATWSPGETAYYPISDDANHIKYAKYKERAESELRLVLGGRLGEYRYYDMDQVIASAMSKVKKLI